MYRLLRRLKIKHRISIIVGLGIIGAVLMLAVATFHAEQQYITLEKENTKNLVESAKNLAKHYFQRYEQGELNEIEAKKLALDALKNIGYDSRSYVYIYHDMNFMVMHPDLPEQSLSDLTAEDRARSKVINDQQFEQHRLRYDLEERRHSPMEILRKYEPETRTGFFNYHYIADDNGLVFIAELDDPDIPSNAPPKIGYGSYFGPWQWTIMGGVYLGDLEKSVAASVLKLVSMLLIIVVALALTSWLISRSITKPLAEGMSIINRNLLKRNFKIPEDYYGDEIHRQGVAFHALINQLDERDITLQNKSLQLEQINRDLIEHKENLEKTVEERTLDFKLAKDQAEAATKAKSRFLATMTHELRTPMSGVLGIVDLLNETALSKSQEEYVNIISASGKQLLDIVGDILNFEKLSANKMELERIPLDLKKLLDELVMPFQLRLKENNAIQYSIVINDDCPRYVIGDPVRIKQVVNNFLSNAHKFTKTGSVAVRARRLDKQENDFLVIEVIDTGVGLTSEQQQKLFDEYHQAEKSVSREFGGTGLGLSISKKIVDLMGGSIGVHSAIGKGSTFHFDFPLEEASDLSIIQNIESDDLDKHIDLRLLKVLVAEDNPVNQMVIKGYLRRLGIDPLLVENGKMVLEQIVSSDFDIILMDINMPIMDGVEACKIIREKEGNNDLDPVAIYALTADAMENSKISYEEVGMNGTLAKPIKFQQLVSVLDAVAMTLIPRSNPNGISEQPKFIS